MKKRVWALLDNRMGSVGQIRGVAAALNPAHYKICLLYTSPSPRDA